MRCDGCLGNRECWVCLGTGILLRRDGSETPCHRCEDTGRCPVCRAPQTVLTRAG